MLEAERGVGERPILVATSAKDGPNRKSFSDLRLQLARNEAPHLLILGTGWGLTGEILDRADLVLEPFAARANTITCQARRLAIMLDRLLG